MSIGIVLLAAACGHSEPPTQPTGPGAPPPVSVPSTKGRVIDALTQLGLGGVTVSGTEITTAVSDSSGAIAIAAPSGAGNPIDVVFSGAAVVDRRTRLRVPGSDAVVSLIPGIFDLRAFDEMFRLPMLLRWTTQPPLLVDTQAGQFTDVNAPDAMALNDEMSDDQYALLIADLSWALPQLTGGAFGTFASVTRQSSTPDSIIHLLNDGSITVVRLVGLAAVTGFWGYARWQFRDNGEIRAGLVMLDRDFDRSNSPFRRSLRTHEFGHALGYQHVATRPSFMNTSATLEPTDWDRDACRIAFQRPPGNRSPDVDPSDFSTNRLGPPATWSPAVR